MSEAVEGCVHCGFCLPACPTYRELGEEMDSPRGRIYLMKAALEETIDFADARPYVDRCLGCLACEPACPSGVQYHRLLHGYRGLEENRAERPWRERVRQGALHSLMARPARFGAALRLARLVRPLSALLPASLRRLVDFAAEALPRSSSAPLPAVASAVGERRARVGLLTGCVQSVLAPEISAAAIAVLTRNGVEVVVPPAQGCCGSLALHEGDLGRARGLASGLVGQLPGDVDIWLSTAAGCGSGIAEYSELFEGSELRGRASAFAGKVHDVHVFLDEIGLREQPRALRPVRVAYQDACHLLHARGIGAEPRRLLASIEGVELVEIGDGGACCGSAGTYNLDQPEIAARLGEAKADAIAARNADIVASGNIGCLVQIRRHSRASGSPTVLHSLEILAAAYRGELGADAGGPEGPQKRS
jgi:glycolate oxidase iron-sulfur subunit